MNYRTPKDRRQIRQTVGLAYALPTLHDRRSQWVRQLDGVDLEVRDEVEN